MLSTHTGCNIRLYAVVVVRMVSCWLLFGAAVSYWFGVAFVAVVVVVVLAFFVATGVFAVVFDC